MDTITIKLSESIKKYPKDVQESIARYLEQLGEKERKAYYIAESHLGSSFNIVKSNGYINWKNKSNSFL
jgi:hypothetical protein